MNKKIIYFILILLALKNIVSIEKLDIDDLMAEKMNKIKNKELTTNTNLSNDNLNVNLEEDYDSKANSIVSSKLDIALAKNNITNIVSDENEIENEVIVNEPVVISNNQKAGGVNQIMLIFAIFFILLHLLKK